MSILKGKKTFIAGLGLVILGVVQAFGGAVEPGLQSILSGLGIIFLRQGVKDSAAASGGPDEAQGE